MNWNMKTFYVFIIFFYQKNILEITLIETDLIWTNVTFLFILKVSLYFLIMN